VATDAHLTKAQCTRLAVAAHDGLARALVPSHTLMDGDAIFAAATGARGAPDLTEEVALGHAAACVMARAVARGVYAARPMAGDSVPAWSARFA
jgi:D-aminopeptidase